MKQDEGAVLRVGVMGCSAFAARAMMPAIRETPGLCLAAVASRSREKAQQYAGRFGCEAVTGYDALLDRGDLDCIYMPLPAGLHRQWVRRALESGRHLLVEKPFTVDLESALELIALARRRRLLVVEDFLFPHHAQTAWVRGRLAEGAIGEVHLFRSHFGFPPLEPGNFRYDAALGGGALLDAGVYLVKATRMFLGNDARLVAATLKGAPGRSVEIEGTATFCGSTGAVAQVAFGFDSFYQCNWEFVGRSGKLVAERAYTPPPNFAPVVQIERAGRREIHTLAPDNHYRNMLDFFIRTLRDESAYAAQWDELEQQARQVEDVRRKGLRI